MAPRFGRQTPAENHVFASILNITTRATRCAGRGLRYANVENPKAMKQSVILLLLGVLLSAQQTVTSVQTAPQPPQTPPRDQQRATQGAAVLRGTVVDAETGAPVRRANVEAFGPPGRSAAVTDGDGRFEIRD